jgi:tRNA modification GTPase
MTPDLHPDRPVLDATILGDGRTIAAIATPTGRGALALVRVSGPATEAIVARLLDPPPTEHRRAVHTRVVTESGEVLDDVVAIRYRAPHSFTGEDLLEISTHGGLVVPTAVLAAAIRAGARQAEPGEFTRRAVLNGKLDLLQAEAIGDLVDARSTAAHRSALRQLDGGLSTRVLRLRDRVLDLEALLAYDIDFPEEDDGPVPRERIAAACDEVLRDVGALLATGDQGTLINEGALVILAGAPNAGKSSLFNALLGEARAIVTDIPGTTRDAIEAVLDRPRWPLRLVDTAGLRPSDDPLERLGIETSTRYLGRAALVLACGDGDGAVEEVTAAIRTHTGAPILGVRTKADLVAEGAETSSPLRVSARTGEGIPALLDAIDRCLIDGHGVPELDAPGLTRERHLAAVAAARTELAAFQTAWREQALPASVAATHVRAAADALGELIGVVRTDDVLDVVFRRFCVGK